MDIVDETIKALTEIDNTITEYTISFNDGELYDEYGGEFISEDKDEADELFYEIREQGKLDQVHQYYAKTWEEDEDGEYIEQDVDVYYNEGDYLEETKKVTESKETPYDNTTEKTCPICGKKYTQYPAVSRKDNKTYICPECGVAEALNDFARNTEKKTESKLEEDNKYIKSHKSTNYGWSNNAETIYGELNDGNYYVYTPDNGSISIYDEPITDKYLDTAYNYGNEDAETDKRDDEWYDNFDKEHNVTARYSLDDQAHIMSELDISVDLYENKKVTEAVEDKTEVTIQEKSDDDIGADGIEDTEMTELEDDPIDTEEEVKENIKKDLIKFCKQSGIDIDKVKANGIKLKTVDGAIDEMTKDMVSSAMEEFIKNTNDTRVWDYEIVDNDVDIILAEPEKVEDTKTDDTEDVSEEDVSATPDIEVEESKKITESVSKNEIKYNLHNDKTNDVWIVGTVDYRNKTYNVEAKVYLEGSKFGIDKGPVSKFHISIDNKTIVNYDRGWDVKPTEEDKPLYDMVLSAVQQFRKENPYTPDDIDV